MDNRYIANLTDVRTTDAFNELTNAIRKAGFEVEWVDEMTGFHISVPEGYDFDDESERVIEVAYRNRVNEAAKRFIRGLATHDRLYQEVPGSIPTQYLGDYEEVMDNIAFTEFDHEMVIRYSDASPPPNYAVGDSAVDRIDKELIAMYAKDIAKRASVLVEGTADNGWTPEWDAIESNDEYECYVYVEENDLDR